MGMIMSGSQSSREQTERECRARNGGRAYLKLVLYSRLPSNEPQMVLESSIMRGSMTSDFCDLKVTGRECYFDFVNSSYGPICRYLCQRETVDFEIFFDLGIEYEDQHIVVQFDGSDRHAEMMMKMCLFDTK